MRSADLDALGRLGQRSTLSYVEERRIQVGHPVIAVGRVDKCELSGAVICVSTHRDYVDAHAK
jgi:hypothetical protein